MADPFVAEIRIFPFNFPPTGWAFCNGQLMPISQNTALFSLLGTTYGGDGKSTFALPDLQGYAPMQPGQGQGLSLRDLGEVGGSETVTLLESEIPRTRTRSGASTRRATTRCPDGEHPRAAGSRPTVTSTNSSANLVAMAAQALPPAGGNLPHNNMQPHLTSSFCLALQGVFPPRT